MSTSNSRPDSLRLDNIFSILLNQNDLKTPPTEIRFSETTEQEILRILNSEIPLKMKYDLDNEISGSKLYQYIQADYTQNNDDIIVVFKLGNESDSYKGKLFNLSLSIRHSDQKINETENETFLKLRNTFGNQFKTGKFETSVLGGLQRTNDNLYLWEKDGFYITYRCMYNNKSNSTTIVINYWDSSFYKTHAVWKYA